jgi:DNA-binding SARP family transcriptional activator
MNNKVTYRQQYTRCGKERCRKCKEGSGHGPYWYAYWSEKGHTVSKYIGVQPPEQLATSSNMDEGREQSETSASTHSQNTPILRIHLLGQFRIEHYNQGEWQAADSRTSHRRRTRALLGCLLSSPSRRLGREQVMDMLWPNLDIELAANRLNGAVHELRQILEPDISRPSSSRFLRLERDMLELADNTLVWVDAEVFEQLLKDAEMCTDTQQTEQLLEEAATLYEGNYLPEELYSEWAVPRRDALQRAWVGLQLRLTQIKVEQGAYVSAIEILDR